MEKPIQVLTTKKCTKCGEEKPYTLEFFDGDKGSKSGLKASCKVCCAKRHRIYRQNNKEKLRVSARIYREEVKKLPKPEYPPDATKECAVCGEEKLVIEFYKDASRPEGVKWDCKECCEVTGRKSRERIKGLAKPQYLSGATKKCSMCGEKKIVTEFHKDASNIHGLTSQCKKCRNKKKMEWTKLNLDTDPVFKLQSRMRSAMCAVLSGRNKLSRTFDYIGTTPEELWQHFESQFQPGMTRENYGEWHVDHIRPLASFDFEGDNLEAALHECWHYTNLQPLWAKDNIKKGAKWDG